MALHNADLREIMAKCRVERQALFGPVAEISRRLQPRHLVDVTAQYAKDKVAAVVGGVSDTIKDNGGTAAVAALGAVAVFDAGRRSAKGANNRAHAPEPHSETLDRGEGAGRGPVLHAENPRKAITNLARAKMLAGSAGGLLIGHVIGRSFKPSDKERVLFGKAAGEARAAALEFASQHSHGAKLAAAQAFGFARYSAAFLALMAAVSDHFGGSEAGSDRLKTD